MGDESFLLGVSVSDILVLLLLNGRMVEISWQEMKMEGQYLFESNQLCSNWSTVMGREGKWMDLGVINMQLGNLWDGIFKINHRGLFRYDIYLITASYGVFVFGYAKDLVSLVERLWNMIGDYFLSIFIDISLVVMFHQESKGFGIKFKKELVIKYTDLYWSIRNIQIVNIRIDLESLYDLIEDNNLIWYRALYWSIRNTSLVVLVYIDLVEKRFLISQISYIFSTLNDLILVSHHVSRPVDREVRGKER